MTYTKRKTFHQLLLSAPALLIYSAFVVIPIGGVIYYSFLDWDGLSPFQSFVGLDNYVRLLGDSQFLKSVWNTVVFTVWTVVLANALGMFLATALNGSQVTRRVLRAVYFIPLLISPVAGGYILRTILGFRGILNQIIVEFGLERQNILGNPDAAIYALIIFAVWQSVGLTFVIYLSAMQAIPTELYDAASIDGAGVIGKFSNVTFPWLAPAVTTSTVSMFTFAMREYARVAILTDGGPINSTETIVFQIVRTGFAQNRLSYASSQAVIMLLIVGLVAVTLVTVLRKREEFLT